jgi:Type II secretion system (T2SS), protein E, N-terminal domain
MQSHIKRLGEMLVDAGLISAAQLQEALRHQRFAGGRMGTNLVALGFISEEVLMDFLAHQTGVPRADFRNLNVDSDVLKRVPRRLAEQLTILPLAFKEPKSLVLAMADPSDLNAIDSARFASGLTIEPVVASHSSLRSAIAEQYRKLDPGTPTAITVEVGPPLNLDEALPVNFEIPALGAVPTPKAAPPVVSKGYPTDPFFDGSQPAPSIDPFGLFDVPGVEPPPAPSPELPPALLQSASPSSTFPGATSSGGLIHERSAKEGRIRSLESFQTRALVHGLIRLLQKRGVLGEDEIQRYLTNLIESGQIKEDGRD